MGGHQLWPIQPVRLLLLLLHVHAWVRLWICMGMLLLLLLLHIHMLLPAPRCLMLCPRWAMRGEAMRGGVMGGEAMQGEAMRGEAGLHL